MESVQHAFSRIEQCGLLAASAGALLRQQLPVSLLRVHFALRPGEKARVLEVGNQVAVLGAKQPDAGDAREADDVGVVGAALRCHGYGFAIHLGVIFPVRPAPSRKHSDRAKDSLVPHVLFGELPSVRDLLARSAVFEESPVHRPEIGIVVSGENEVGDVRVNDQAQGAIASR